MTTATTLYTLLDMWLNASLVCTFVCSPVSPAKRAPPKFVFSCIAVDRSHRTRRGCGFFPLRSSIFPASGTFSAWTWHFFRFRYFSRFRSIFSACAEIFLVSAKDSRIGKDFSRFEKEFLPRREVFFRFRYFFVSKQYFSRCGEIFFSLRRGM